MLNSLSVIHRVHGRIVYNTEVIWNKKKTDKETWWKDKIFKNKSKRMRDKKKAWIGLFRWVVRRNINFVFIQTARNIASIVTFYFIENHGSEISATESTVSRVRQIEFWHLKQLTRTRCLFFTWKRASMPIPNSANPCESKLVLSWAHVETQLPKCNAFCFASYSSHVSAIAILFAY